MLDAARWAMLAISNNRERCWGIKVKASLAATTSSTWMFLSAYLCLTSIEPMLRGNIFFILCMVGTRTTKAKGCLSPLMSFSWVRVVASTLCRTRTLVFDR
ncbi:hypothetical protein MPTK1_3g19020 [Marchantia polymorpha subsp. ruderalis]|uniref:Uncharacterized protein n=2 Tax=Marchantia polymorpha TaxID=3197 RepID=A0AAF6B2E0_MARPO|nr:hypothetical protein MARPO_0049s0131 [Marchantia polymorpha]BBN06174.1 hypothetical protein Mp_3g19020 [Marchantia polymorpha subsp. ruderalis]|eukprot:PTQ38864.1 hypothetical protein MARPO_0049s0131 [Marchantia polymorpha]